MQYCWFWWIAFMDQAGVSGMGHSSVTLGQVKHIHCEVFKMLWQNNSSTYQEMIHLRYVKNLINSVFSLPVFWLWNLLKLVRTPLNNSSRLLKSTFSLSMHIYNSDGRHAWFHLHGASRPARSASEATKYKMKNFLSTVGLEPTTLWFKVWCSTDWASRAWWMLSI